MTDSSGFDTEIKEFIDATDNIEKDFVDMQTKRNEVYDLELALKKRIAEQVKTTSRLKRLAQQEKKPSKDVDDRLSNLSRRQREILNPGSKFVQYFLGTVNSVVLTGPSSRKYLFKQEYEQFKYTRTLWSIGFSLLLLFFFQSR
jgi:hypothetical protein